jgi:hypothetical protein
MPLATRAIARGDLPRVHEPKSKHKAKATTGKKPPTKTKATRKRHASDSESEDDEDESEDSAPVLKKKRAKQRRVENSEEEIEMVNTDIESSKEDIEEVDGGHGTGQLSSEQEVSLVTELLAETYKI